MGRRKKTPTIGHREEMIMRRNIERRLNVMFPRATETDQFEGLKKLSGVGKETIRLFMKGGSSMTLQNLQSIAQAISLTLAELFTEETQPKDGPQASDDRSSGQLHPR